MIKTMTYKTALMVAMGLHIVLACFLLMERHQDHFVVKSSASSESIESAMTIDSPKEHPIQAVSVDSQAVTETLNRLKEERAQKQQAELNHQRAVEQQLHMAQQQRLQEQKNLERMKKEAAQLALAQQKKLAIERQHLKELAEQKNQQERHLADLKQQQLQLQKQQQQQQQEQQRLAEAQKKKIAEAARAQQEQAALQEKNRLAQQTAAAAAAQRSAQMSGEVNKYKALIIQAISQHWILPERVDRNLSSKFRIRLAPDGKVLEVSLISSSGDPVLDRSAQSAIYKASPLPVPTDQAMFNMFRDISLTVRPESARG
ncbi:MAG: protein TolA [Legionella sp.]|nr:MAG: protein TolA [Legionella sp.]